MLIQTVTVPIAVLRQKSWQFWMLSPAEQLEQEIKHRIEVEKLRQSSDVKESHLPQLELM